MGCIMVRRTFYSRNSQNIFFTIKYSICVYTQRDFVSSPSFHIYSPLRNQNLTVPGLSLFLNHLISVSRFLNKIILWAFFQQDQNVGESEIFSVYPAYSRLDHPSYGSIYFSRRHNLIKSNMTSNQVHNDQWISYLKGHQFSPIIV